MNSTVCYNRVENNSNILFRFGRSNGSSKQGKDHNSIRRWHLWSCGQDKGKDCAQGCLSGKVSFHLIFTFEILNGWWKLLVHLGMTWERQTSIENELLVEIAESCENDLEYWTKGNGWFIRLLKRKPKRTRTSGLSYINPSLSKHQKDF